MFPLLKTPDHPRIKNNATPADTNHAKRVTHTGRSFLELIQLRYRIFLGVADTPHVFPACLSPIVGDWKRSQQKRTSSKRFRTFRGRTKHGEAGVSPGH